MEAYQLYEDEIVKDSGLPYWITRSLDPNVQIIIEEREDIANKALGQWDEKENKRKKKRHGISRYAVPVDADGQPLVYGGLKRQEFRQAASQVERDHLEVDIEVDRPEGGYDPAEYGDGVTSPA